MADSAKSLEAKLTRTKQQMTNLKKENQELRASSTYTDNVVTKLESQLVTARQYQLHFTSWHLSEKNIKLLSQYQDVSEENSKLLQDVEQLSQVKRQLAISTKTVEELTDKMTTCTKEIQDLKEAATKKDEQAKHSFVKIEETTSQNELASLRIMLSEKDMQIEKLQNQLAPQQKCLEPMEGLKPSNSATNLCLTVCTLAAFFFTTIQF